MRYVLASASPRRRELLGKILSDFDVETADVDERAVDLSDPSELCMELARRKCLAVAAHRPEDCVIGCDTVVFVAGQVLGKPKDREDELRMLSLMSGSTHHVYTGVHLEAPGVSRSFFCRTGVKFWELTPEEMEAYASSADPYDKAGGYGIQSGAAVFCESTDGDYFNVMGLPVSMLYHELRDLGLPIL